MIADGLSRIKKALQLENAPTNRFTAWYSAVLSAKKEHGISVLGPLRAHEVQAKLARPGDKTLSTITPRRGVLMIDVTSPDGGQMEVIVCGPSLEIIHSAIRDVRSKLLLDGGLLK